MFVCLSQYKTAVVAAQEAVHPLTREVRRLRRDFLLDAGGGAWYEQVVNVASLDANAEVSSYLVGKPKRFRPL